MKVFTEHFIIDEKTFNKSQTNNEKNEEEKCYRWIPQSLTITNMQMIPH